MLSTLPCCGFTEIGMGFGASHDWVQTLSPSFISGVTSGKLFSLSGPWFTCDMELLELFSEGCYKGQEDGAGQCLA